MRRLWLLALTLLAMTVPSTLVGQQEPVVVFLVRHAERGDDGTSDPPITEAGQDRGRLLARMLRDSGLTQIHTTDYRRTRMTVQPVAEETGLRLLEYDANDLAGLAGRLRRTPGRHLVVGHSDTTPALVAMLGGEPGDPIADDEYDRLYILTLTADGTSTVLIRYGEPPNP